MRALPRRGDLPDRTRGREDPREETRDRICEKGAPESAETHPDETGVAETQACVDGEVRATEIGSAATEVARIGRSENYFAAEASILTAGAVAVVETSR
jgi:hypothetical protein